MHDYCYIYFWIYTPPPPPPRTHMHMYPFTPNIAGLPLHVLWMGLWLHPSLTHSWSHEPTHTSYCSSAATHTKLHSGLPMSLTPLPHTRMLTPMIDCSHLWRLLLDRLRVKHWLLHDGSYIYRATLGAMTSTPPLPPSMHPNWIKGRSSIPLWPSSCTPSDTHTCMHAYVRACTHTCTEYLHPLRHTHTYRVPPSLQTHTHTHTHTQSIQSIMQAQRTSHVKVHQYTYCEHYALVTW